MSDTTQKLFIGGGGLASSEIAQEIVIPSLEQVETGAGIITQIVILFVTLWGLLKRKNKDQNKKNNQ